MKASEQDATPRVTLANRLKGAHHGLLSGLCALKLWTAETVVTDAEYEAALVELDASSCAYPHQPPMHGGPDDPPGTYRRRGNPRSLTPRRAHGRASVVLGGRK